MRRKNSACGHSMRNLNLKLVNMDGGSGVGLIIAHMSIMSTLRIGGGHKCASNALTQFVHLGFRKDGLVSSWRDRTVIGPRMA